MSIVLRHRLTTNIVMIHQEKSDWLLTLMMEESYFKRLHRSQSYFDALSIYDKLPELYGYKEVTFGEFYSYREDD